jgi:serine/threonine-protein kinase
MICSTCKASNVEGARFCSSCGVELRERKPPPPQSLASDEEITRQQSGRAAQEATLVDRHGDRLLGSTVAGKYRIEATLGTGGMGAVYRATRPVIGDEVAVKILHSEQSDPKAAERFRREAQAAARLKHPNAVTIYDFGVTDDGLQYLVMELVEGESLRRIIKQQGPLIPSASAEIIDQVCAALDEAHRHNIIHRDIKPDNIIVSVSAVGLRVKVLDFGIAKLRDDTASNLTQTGSILGTPHYMSPEQCLGEELDTRSDIYSVGIVLYEMLTGLVPFNSPTSAAVVVQQVTQPPPSLRALNASLSPAVEIVVLHALEKQRGARPQTASELAREFKTATTQPNVPPPAFSIPYNPEHHAFSSGIQGSGSIPTMVTPVHPSGHRLDNPTPGNAGATQNTSKQTSLVVLVVVMAAIILLGLGSLAAWAFLKPSSGPTAVNTAPPGILPSVVGISATASSVRPPEPGASYDAGNAIDGRLNTAWVEGVDGSGVSQWIRFSFDREVNLRGLTIAPGYFKTPQIWSINNRLALAEVQFSDGSTQRVRFNDRMEQQQISLGSVKTSWVQILIKEVYFARDQQDTALSEVAFDFGDGYSGSARVPTATPFAESRYDAAEARIRSGQMIGTTDLTGMSTTELRRLRNTIFARHGRMFDSPDLQTYFSTKPWYSQRYDYSERDLTSADKANLNLISTLEKGMPKN